jgi:DNA-binding MarR family transcriptional regulator
LTSQKRRKPDNARIMQKYMDFNSALMRGMRGRRRDDNKLGAAGFRMANESQGRALLILAEEGVLPQKALVERLGVKAQSASEMVRKLEGRGLVVRQRSEEDARAFNVAITEEGRALATEMSQAKPIALDALTDEEKLQFEAILDKLTAAVERPDE